MVQIYKGGVWSRRKAAKDEAKTAKEANKPAAASSAANEEPTLVKMTEGLGVMSDLEKKFVQLEKDLIAKPVHSANEGETDIFMNNRKWREQMMKSDPEFFTRHAKGQKPEILWIGCADSRVPANQIIDLGPGEVFVHRNIANMCSHSDMSFLSVLQYAVQYLKVKNIMVVGHYNCGGCKAALGDSRLGLIDNWLRHIRDVRRMNEKYLSQCKTPEEELDRLIELNVLEQVHNVCSTSIVQDAWDAGQELNVHGVVYGVGDGLLRDLGVVVNSSDDISSFYRTKSGAAKAVSEGNPNSKLGKHIAGQHSALDNQMLSITEAAMQQPAGEIKVGSHAIFQRNRNWRERMIKEDPEFFSKLANTQKPEILWIGCADSRVPANQLINLPPGEVFVHRNIANMCIHSDISFLSVLQYAVQYLGVKKVVVCGHYACGGCAAALGDNRLGLIDNWLRHIRDVRRNHNRELSTIKNADEALDRLIELNVLEQMHNVCSTSIVQDAWDRGQELTIQGVVYGVGDGKLRDVGVVAKTSDDIGTLYKTKQ